MPIYEYKCSKCGHTFELIQKFSDDPVSTCPVCGGKVERLVSAPAIQFKGSGWYITDYAHKNSPSKSPAITNTEKKEKEPEKKNKPTNNNQTT